MIPDTGQLKLPCCCSPSACTRPQNAGATIGEAELEAIREHARQSYPDECCGVLVGLRRHRVEARAVHPTENRDTGRAGDRYEIDPREILRLDRAAEQAGHEIVGFYHSHPDHPAAPSARDIELAWPGYVYLIVSVDQFRRTEVKAWRFDHESRQFSEEPIRSRGARRRKLGRIYKALTSAWR